MSNVAAKQLRAAADHIEKVGLNQDGKYFQGKNPYSGAVWPDRPCCVLGAIAVVESIRPTQYSAAKMALYALFTRSVTDWSDNTPQNEVVATLRKIADDLEKENNA